MSSGRTCKNGLIVSFSYFVTVQHTKERIWHTYHTKVPIVKGYFGHVEKMPMSVTPVPRFGVILIQLSHKYPRYFSNAFGSYKIKWLKCKFLGSAT